MKVADDKAQALFDNCFKIAEGPDAPDVAFQELDRELILYLSNRKVSNNYNESYNQKNPFIAIPDTLDGVYYPTDDDKDTLKFYKFQGYQIYQVKNGLITVGELDNPDVSRLAFQVDLKDGVKTLVNFTYNEIWDANVPKLMAAGQDEGIKHSFRIQNDLFASGDIRLVNHKTYYYIAVAYGYNQYKYYDPNDPLALDGQKLTYIGSRKMAGGQGIRAFSAIPHNPAPEEGGTIANSEYGDMPQITRLEGQGNGGNDLELTAASEASIVSNNFMNYPTYKSGKGPIQVKVVDPLRVKAGVYKVQFKDSTGNSLGDAYWSLHLPNGNIVNSDQSISVENEQLFLDDGLSITIKQTDNPGVNKDLGNGVIGSAIEYEDSTLNWLSGFSDREGENDGNWIRSGNSVFDNGTITSVFNDYDDGNFQDPEQNFEGMIDGTWAPYRLVSYYKPEAVGATPMNDALGLSLFNGAAVKGSGLKDISSVDIVYTSDKSKWSRAMVLEARNELALTTPANNKHLELRNVPSVDKSGNPDGSGTNGLGWFPGYAINVETGERLNIAFAEDSWLAGENGRDMKWNPTANAVAGITQQLMMGGKHYVYVFRKTTSGTPLFPTYDQCATLHGEMSSGQDIKKMIAFRSCIWAGIPMLNQGHSLLETTAKVKLRVEKPYDLFTTSSTLNAGLPYYQFDMSGLEVETGMMSAMDSTLELINVVPNPYYAYSEYETGKLDNRIKITNLPEICTISIYNVNGTLMRRFQKDEEKTSLDWDLKNHVDIPVASGVYLIHVKVPDVGERTLKWYGVMKPTDLNNF